MPPYFSCTLYSMSSSLVKYEVVHACFSCCFEIGKMLLARLDNWKKMTLGCKDNSMIGSPKSIFREFINTVYKYILICMR